MYVLEKFVINGGRPLMGEVTISGAKNAAVAILPATILAQGVCVIDNLPNISDVTVCVRILVALGAQVRMLSRTCMEIDTTHVRPLAVQDDLCRQMRASYYFLGALLGRFGQASVAMPGGCNLGSRPIDQHLKAFREMGADCGMESGQNILTTEAGLHEAHIFFDTVSVGATINAILAACRAEGTVVLENVAKEPHVVDVANFLNSCGADIRGAGTDVIKIRGVQYMHGCEYAVIPDQIEAGTYMVGAALTGGNVLIRNVIPKHLEPITDKLEDAGASVEIYDDAVRVWRTGEILPVNVKTAPYPGFPTDMQSLMGVLLCRAAGTSIITESVWESRFRYVEELHRMGANIQVNGKVAVFEGVPELQAAPVCATDLRAGAAMVMAALAAEGSTEIDGIEYIERGYGDIVEKLQALGADIRRVEFVQSNSINQVG